VVLSIEIIIRSTVWNATWFHFECLAWLDSCFIKWWAHWKYLLLLMFRGGFMETLLRRFGSLRRESKVCWWQWARKPSVGITNNWSSWSLDWRTVVLLRMFPVLSRDSSQIICEDGGLKAALQVVAFYSLQASEATMRRQAGNIRFNIAGPWESDSNATNSSIRTSGSYLRHYLGSILPKTHSMPPSKSSSKASTASQLSSEVPYAPFLWKQVGGPITPLYPAMPHLGRTPRPSTLRRVTWPSRLPWILKDQAIAMPEVGTNYPCQDFNKSFPLYALTQCRHPHSSLRYSTKAVRTETVGLVWISSSKWLMKLSTISHLGRGNVGFSKLHKLLRDAGWQATLIYTKAYGHHSLFLSIYVFPS
jgi:hypothetical protein